MFIVFEGIDGVGKSTQIELLTGALVELEYDVVSTREPGGTEVGEEIRALLKSDFSMGIRTELLLMLASRSQHVDTLIRPGIERGCVVISDRFEASTFAYQGYGRGVDLSRLRAINEFATGGLKPDVTFLIDRESSFRETFDDDRFESAGIEFAKRVREGYLELSREEGWVVIDGDREINAIQGEILEHLRLLGLTNIKEGKS